MSRPNRDLTLQEAGPHARYPLGYRLLPLLAFCLCFYGLAVHEGIRAGSASDSHPTDFLASATFGICICAWALTDARRRGQPIPYSLRIWFYWLAPVVVPGYILGTRGWRGLGYLVFHALAWIVLMLAAMMLTGLATLAAAG